MVETSEYYSTAAALDALFVLDPASVPYTKGLDWLTGQIVSPTDYLSRRIIAQKRAGLDASAELNTLILYRNPEGGWGGEDDYLNDVIDTALAAQALKAASYGDLSIVNAALAYLTGSQNADGGWGLLTGDGSNTYMTALVSATLQQFSQTTTLATAVSKATSYLLAHQNTDGGFGSSPSTVYETALAYAALVAVTADNTVLNGAISYLTAAQASNGSWNDDPYSTALALQALYLSENRPAPPPPPSTTSTVIGTVVDASTGQPLSNVSVTLLSNDPISTTTDGAGAFTLSDIPQGSQQIIFSLAGYSPLTVTAKVTAGSFSNLGRISLSVNPSTGIVMGTVWDADADAPFAGVQILVTGTGFYQTVTAADGTYRITGVNPGPVTVSTPAGPKPGYWGASFTGTLAPGGILLFSPALSTTPPPGGLKGSVFDASTNNPIQGASITLDPIPTGVEPGVTDAAGAFSIANIPVGSYTVSVSASGYSTQSFTAGIQARGETNVNVPLLPQSSAATISGVVTAAATGSPIAGAEVSIAGTSKSVFTDSGGHYTLSGITEMALTLKASAEGYDSTVISFTLEAYGAFDVPFALAESGTSATTIFGAVWDAETNSPIEGAEISIQGATASAQTDASGKYELGGIADMAVHIKASATGYDSKYYPLTFDVFGRYEISFALNKSRASTVVINTLSTDKQAYNANASVNILSEIENIGDAAVEAAVSAQIADQYGNILGIVPYPGNPVTIDPHAVQTFALQWSADQNPPGPYQITLGVTDRDQGGLLAERGTLFALSPTQSIDGLVSIITPRFINVKADETIALSAYFVNRSNADASLTVQYEIKDPDGSVLKDGAIDISLAISEQFKVVSLTDFAHTFTKSGQYPVSVRILAGAELLSQTTDAIYVAPSIRIEPAKSLDPVTVVPDGDKEIRINIQIQGVEDLQ